MEQEHHHQELISGIAKQLEPVLKKSKQAVYIYLDDVHKVCNENWAKLLGYKSAQEWADIEAPLADVDEAYQNAVISAYQNAVELFTASSLAITLKNVDNKKLIKANMILVPMVYQGHVFSVHFVSQA
jgi:hypothetical protein